MFTLALAIVVVGLFPAEAPARDYEVGPGDVLRVRVWREDDLSADYSIDPRGRIHFPLLGEVPVAGKTVREIEQTLIDQLGRDYLVDPVVTVTVEEYRSRKVFLLGHVTKPGVYYLGEENSLLRVLLEAGGPATSSVAGASILRFNEGPEGPSLEHLRSDLHALFKQGDLSEDVELKPADIVFLTRGGEEDTLGLQDRVFVLGEVKNPGAYRWREGYTVLNAILDAGGLSEFASGNRVRLVRGEGENRKVERVEAAEILEGELDKNIVLQPGDLISVPESFF